MTMELLERSARTPKKGSSNVVVGLSRCWPSVERRWAKVCADCWATKDKNEFYVLIENVKRVLVKINVFKVRIECNDF